MKNKKKKMNERTNEKKEEEEDGKCQNIVNLFPVKRQSS